MILRKYCTPRCTLRPGTAKALLLAAVGVDDGVGPCAGAGVWELGAVVQPGCDALVWEEELGDDLLLHIASVPHRVEPGVNDKLSMCQCNAWILIPSAMGAFSRQESCRLACAAKEQGALFRCRCPQLDNPAC